MQFSMNHSAHLHLHEAGPDWPECTGSLFVGFLQMLTDPRSAPSWFPGEEARSRLAFVCYELLPGHNYDHNIDRLTQSPQHTTQKAGGL